MVFFRSGEGIKNFGDLLWSPSLSIEIADNYENIEYDAGPKTYGDGNILTLALYALYFYNKSVKKEVLPLYLGQELMHKAYNIQHDPPKRKKRKAPPKDKRRKAPPGEEIEEYQLFEKNSSWKWKTPVGIICTSESCKHLVSAYAQLEERVKDSDSDEESTVHEVVVNIHDSLMETTTTKFIGPKVFVDGGEYDKMRKRHFFYSLLKPIQESLVKRRVVEAQVETRLKINLLPSVLYQQTFDDNSCGISAVLHMISKMFPTAGVVDDVEGINDRFKTVEEYKRIMYTLFVYAALHFIWNNNFVAFDYMQTDQYIYQNKRMEEIESFVNLKGKLKEVLVKMNLKEKIGVEIYKLFGFLDCILDGDAHNQSEEGGQSPKSRELVLIGEDASKEQTQNKDGVEAPRMSIEVVVIGDENSISKAQNQTVEGGSTPKSCEVVVIGEDVSNAQTKNKNGDPPKMSNETVTICDETSISKVQNQSEEGGPGQKSCQVVGIGEDASNAQTQNKEGGLSKMPIDVTINDETLISKAQNQSEEGGPGQKSFELVGIGDDASNAKTQNKEGGPPKISSESVTIGDETSISTTGTRYCTGNKHNF